MLTPEQQRIFDWLASKLDLPVFADAYLGAGLQLKDRPPGFVTFVCHTGRDLMNILAATVAGIKAQQVIYRQYVEGIAVEWRDEWGITLAAADVVVEHHSIPISICEKIGKMVVAHKEGSARKNAGDYLFFTVFLDFGDQGRIPATAIAEWKDAREWFVAHAHLRKGEFSEEEKQMTAYHFGKLEQLLLIAATSEFERISGLDEILDETNG